MMSGAVSVIGINYLQKTGMKTSVGGNQKKVTAKGAGEKNAMGNTKQKSPPGNLGAEENFKQIKYGVAAVNYPINGVCKYTPCFSELVSRLHMARTIRTVVAIALREDDSVRHCS
jgi:hypothetical protein